MTLAEQVSAKLRPYPAYQDSGVEWIGDVPVGWEVVRLKQVASEKIRNGVGEPGEHDNPAWPRYIRITDILNEQGLKTDTFRSLPPELIGHASVRKDDLLLAAVGASYGKSYLHCSEGDFCYAGFLVRFRPDKTKVNPRLALYWAQSAVYWNQLNSEVIQATIQNFSASRYAELKFPLPPLSEQPAITAFLDRETARIDELLREQGALLEDLGEKRRATINAATHAVPGVSADQLPAGWRLVPLKSVLLSMEQGWSPQCDNRPADEGEWGVLKVGCVNGHRFNPVENKALPGDLEPMRQYALKRDDVLISRANTRDLVGSAARVEEDYSQLLLCDKLYRLRTDGALLLPAYLVFLLGSPLARAAIEQAASGASSSMLNISQATIKNLVLPIPPTAHQEAILERLDTQLAQIVTLMTEVRASIEDMRLHRSALITAAVTGKIDVRDWQPA